MQFRQRNSVSRPPEVGWEGWMAQSVSVKTEKTSYGGSQKGREGRWEVGRTGIRGRQQFLI